MPYAAVFDASQHAPQQVGGKHPCGNKFPATITGTDVKDTKDNQGKYFEVTFTTPAGSIRNNYNLWNASKTAVDIAVGQLSAVCHATGIFKVDFNNDGAALRGGKCLIDVGFQAGQEPSAEKPEGGYVEIKKVYDANGNEPGKGPAPQASSGFTAQQPQQQPQQQAPQPNPAPQVQQGWAPQQNAAPASPPAAGGWQQGNAGVAGEKPPWG